MHKAFNQEVENYRRILLNCAGKSEWNSFKLNAGKLFDYVESVEMAVLEKKFFRISFVVMCILFVLVGLIVGTSFDMKEEVMRIRKLMILVAFMGSSFQLYFFVNFWRYMGRKITCYERRRERFIRDIEQDFRSSWTG